MSDFPKWVIGIILWLLLTIGSYIVSKQCICGSLPFCGHTHTTALPPITPTTVTRLPLDFSWSNASTHTNEGFTDYKTALLVEKDSTNILEITGFYIEGEENTSTYSNIGLARANAIKDLFINDLPYERIRLVAKKIPFTTDKKSNFFEGASFNWIAGKSSNVEIFSDKTIIRFPFNSVEKEMDTTIDDYLAKLAKRVMLSKEKISITGHTDNVGDSKINLKIAERRAKMIRDILIKKGVNWKQIITDSKGDSEPISSNQTEQGKQENRRVVIKLLAH